MITKTILDELVIKYETIDFIKDDPIQFPHKYDKIEDIELVGFISSLFAYGNRKQFNSKLKELFGYMGNSPTDYIKNSDFNDILNKDFNYRFSKPYDILELFKILKKLYNNSSSIGKLFEYGYNQSENIIKMQECVIDYFYANANKNATLGFYHLLPNPRKNGPMKRMNMFLRWMVRKSAVDIGIWTFIPKSKLLIPIDVHVSRISRDMGLLNRKNNDIKAVIELTQNLLKFDSNDPVKYDFAIFGKGIEETKNRLN